MNTFNPRKLKLSKWTACTPVNQEKHFMVTQLFCDEAGVPVRIELQAVHSGRVEVFDWTELRDDKRWKVGWQ
ncbi:MULTISPECIES: TIGR02450 family Trp-rich protein [unclassified Pseudomonas]|uniref:TIGR02450 family Trp-rich protein n=1 Tax=unclassified Pseudomonas TaxID=196821 RepID=UPI0039B75899